MSITERISAYLEGDMNDAERHAFEQELTNNHELKSEFDFQHEVIEGIKSARQLELKSMLNDVAIGGFASGGSMTFGKIVSGIVIVGFASLGIYYFTTQETTEPPVQDETVTVADPIEDDNIVSKEENKDKVSETKENTVTNKPVKPEIKQELETESIIPEIKKPETAPLFENEEEVDSLEAPSNNLVDKTPANFTTVDVEIDNTKKKYSFHYKFEYGKLFLYGSFDKGLYEILEFNTTGDKALFLYYKGNFYELDKKQAEISPLEPVTDTVLVEKLKEVIEVDN